MARAAGGGGRRAKRSAGASVESVGMAALAYATGSVDL